ncbi:MAG: glycosyltransferase [Pyrinomonadaceae bacterium]
MKKKIMIFCDFYLPGFKSGGGMWTVVNLVDRFSAQYDFSIVTRNYDSIGDTEPFTTVKTDEWNDIGNADVFYCSKETLTVEHANQLALEIMPDLVYLNSFFGKPQRNFLYARKNRGFEGIPVVLAPCGELPDASLSLMRFSLKPLKKWLYITYAKSINLYRNIIWKASSNLEKNEISAVMGGNCDIEVAPDLVPKIILPEFSIDQKPQKEKGSVKFIFLSRIVPKKNLAFFLERLAAITEGKITFDIAGPHEDAVYWNDCLKWIARMPENIHINIVGPVSYHEGLRLLTESHFFILPTLNENFGYVFIESLAAGCPLLISDRTLWGGVEPENAGWAVPLESPSSWLDKMKYCIDMDDTEYRKMSSAARTYANKWLAESKLEEDTARVLDKAFASSHRVNNDQ